ncbi:MAG: hypothetical protein IJR64_01870, partial [Bacteroidales bacterium]|nr:hypothetical protein [Bacteroidales bacterium]
MVVATLFGLLLGGGMLRAQDPEPAPVISIVIQGDVYGGGRNGAVGTGKTTATESTPQSKVRLNSGALNDPTTTVSIYQGQIRTVFGGGENGRTYGGTNVLVGQSELSNCPVEIGGTVGGTDWTGTIHGGLFGAGDGAAAYVFGHSLVTIQAGTLYQNIYGGGNQADLMGTTSVVLQGGDFRGVVFGGARMADIFGFSFVDIDGEDAKTNLVVNTVYGGNDISGNITSSSNWPWTETSALTLPAALSHAGDYSITTGYNAFLHSSVEATGKHIFVGQLFGGGNGDYAYSGGGDVPYSYTMPTGLADDPATDGVDESVKTFSNLNKPEVSRTYLELKGGTFGYVYGGGNAANVTTSVDICIDNNSSVISSTVLDGIMKTGTPASFENATRLTDMGINWTTFTDEYQFVRVFGGNNKAAMNIRPTWHLLRGSINNLYSGGNEGSMTSPTGLILSLTSPNMTVNNVFGGCRKADVDPRGDKGAGFDMPQETFEGETMEAGFAARVIVKAGTINNVYGGNDISGNVYYGANVHILSNINGDVYGGGNGSYAYTDNAQLASDLLYGDFYYDPSTAASSVEALNLFRPNTESVSLSVKGTSDANPTTIGGSIYCGGNSTSLRNDNAGEATAKLKIGSYVVADRVFLGNNGIDMVDISAGGVLAKYAGTVEDVEGTTRDFSTLDLTNAATFATYMDGVAMSILPEVDFASDYVAYSTKFGSFFCGGNVGSMTYAGVNDIAFNDKVIIFESLVGGCNNADVPAHDGLNAAYKGGILGSAAERASYVDGSGNIKDRLHLTLNGLHLRPMRWKKDGNGDYVLDANDNRQLEWNTFDSRTGLAVTPPTELPAANAQGNNISTEDDIYRRLVGGNVYGGCYTSGHVNGNVVINLDATLTDRNIIFDKVDEDSLGVKLYDNTHYLIKERRSGVLLDEQGMDALGTSLNVFGGGYGAATQIWGSTTINLNKGYTFQIFGGAEQGIIGKLEDGDPAVYNPQYSTYINMDGELPGVARLATGDSPDIAEAEFIYGGGFEGLILGNTQINLGNGRIFNSFAGSCNADILGHTETYVGRGSSDDANLGFPWVRDHIYGGNDLGGRIRGSEDFSGRVSATALAMVYNPTNAASPAVLEASAYTEYMQGRVENIFGGCYGDYDYAGDE